MLVFYRSDRAKTVMVEGFQDDFSVGGSDSASVGCLFSTDPFDASLRTNSGIILFLEIPQSVFNQYAQPQLDGNGRTALIPAGVANQFGPARLLTYKSATLLSRLIKAKRRLSNSEALADHFSSLTGNLLTLDEVHESPQRSGPSVTVS
jgi:hypothetical protein